MDVEAMGSLWVGLGLVLVGGTESCESSVGVELGLLCSTESVKSSVGVEVGMGCCCWLGCVAVSDGVGLAWVGCRG